ncbi:MAG TPA: hypothetical protein VJQ44_15085 [Gemmatimonadales bacterium]|nr:hypothetical protein [Gemmatimonadales bacterium]
MTERAQPCHREARLRADHAQRYPGCPADEWLPASIAAAYVLGHREVLLGRAHARAQRALDPVDWEFRGENGFVQGDQTQRRRFSDRHTSGPYAAVTQVPGQADEELAGDAAIRTD